MGKIRLFEDIRKAVDDDSYMWIVFWGPPRCSKTTLAGWCLYSLYQDWDKVLAAFTFNLNQTMYKMENGLPERWPTLNGLHMRVPALNWDDFGAHSNKAQVQDDPAWDAFKGGFDVLGTKIGVLMATMCDPTEPTLQLVSKYTHEVQILGRGRYKYDKVLWKQDYHGWRTKAKKDPIETNTFDLWPMETYREYDTMRIDLANEVFQRIKDAQAITSIDWILKRIQPLDIEIMELIVAHGPIYHTLVMDKYEANGAQAITRLKSRMLLVPIKKAEGYYKYDLTDLGYDVLKAWSERKQEHSAEHTVQKLQLTH